MRSPLLDELAVVYAEADAALAGWSCAASTECCRFAITGREPYVTSIEVEALVRAVAALGGPRALAAARGAAGVAARGGRRRRLAVVGEGDREGRCPMLDARGRCAVYAWRPLGCRTFFCERASGGAALPQRRVNELVRSVQHIAARHRPEGDRGRPLRRALPFP
jgi:Fe-S-cluster containining protein